MRYGIIFWVFQYYEILFRVAVRHNFLKEVKQISSRYSHHGNANIVEIIVFSVPQSYHVLVQNK